MTKRKAPKKELPKKEIKIKADKFIIPDDGIFGPFKAQQAALNKLPRTEYSHVLGTRTPGKFKIKHNGPKDGTYATCTETLATFPMQDIIPFKDAIMEAAKDLAELVVNKNAAYGNAFEKSREILKVLYPTGLTPAQYKHALAITRIADKLCRIATDEHAFNEEPWKDIAGYALRALVEK